MLAVDTNIDVRYLTGDDALQARRARTLVDNNRVFVATTVVLESEWVLRSYRLTRERILEQLGGFIRLPTVTMEHPMRVSKSLAWAVAGMDFADALHLVRARDCNAFVSFDQRLARVANRLSGTRVQTP